jgi:hypothetical protein
MNSVSSIKRGEKRCINYGTSAAPAWQRLQTSQSLATDRILKVITFLILAVWQRCGSKHMESCSPLHHNTSHHRFISFPMCIIWNVTKRVIFDWMFTGSRTSNTGSQTIDQATCITENTCIQTRKQDILKEDLNPWLQLFCYCFSGLRECGR